MSGLEAGAAHNHKNVLCNQVPMMDAPPDCGCGAVPVPCQNLALVIGSISRHRLGMGRRSIGKPSQLCKTPMTKDIPEAWKTLESKLLLNHPRIKVVEDLVQLPSGEVTSYVRLDSAGNAVTVICIRDGQILMQREYSHPPGEVLLQFPGGKIEGNETPEQAAVRELREESGFTFSQCENLGWYYVNNRRSNSKMYAVLAREVAPAEKAGGDVEEYIDSFWIPVSKLREMIAGREITNFSVLAAWALLANVLED
jgi:ADP-ribose pyrophosphatase